MAKWLCISLIAFSPLVYADQPYLNEHEAGWYWHKDPQVSVHKKVKKDPIASQPPADPQKTWKLIGKMVERARAKAILNPTEANIAQARRFQRLLVAQANLFSEKWILDLLINPEQDESLMNPNNSAARDLYNQHNNLEKERAIAEISQTSGLFYFYHAGEPFSERMAEVVRDFANSYHIALIPIAMSQRFSPLFPNSQADAGQANQMGVKHIPAVFALNPKSQKAMPIAYGLVSQSELKENILLATKAFEQEDYHAS